MNKRFEKINDEELMDMFELHDCKQEKCEICLEYMMRFNPKRLIEIDYDEDPQVNEALLLDSLDTRLADGPSI